MTQQPTQKHMQRRLHCSIRLTAIYLLTSVSPHIYCQTNEKAIESIRSSYQEVGQKIAFIEQGGEAGQHGELVCNELVINKQNHSWPAVGIYQVTYKFYYDFDADSPNPPPYPNRLVKVVATSAISARTYQQEYLFDKTGSLVFYFSQAKESESLYERRYYFTAGRPLRIIEGKIVKDRLSASDHKNATWVSNKAIQVKDLFKQSLLLPTS